MSPFWLPGPGPAASCFQLMTPLCRDDCACHGHPHFLAVPTQCPQPGTGGRGCSQACTVFKASVGVLCLASWQSEEARGSVGGSPGSLGQGEQHPPLPPPRGCSAGDPSTASSPAPSGPGAGCLQHHGQRSPGSVLDSTSSPAGPGFGVSLWGALEPWWHERPSFQHQECQDRTGLPLHPSSERPGRGHHWESAKVAQRWLDTCCPTRPRKTWRRGRQWERLASGQAMGSMLEGCVPTAWAGSLRGPQQTGPLFPMPRGALGPLIRPV